MIDPNASPHPPAPLQVLLVCPRGEHLNMVRSLASQWPLATHIHWTADPAAAMRHAGRTRPVLAIVDARLDRASGRALIEQLGRDADIDVMAFDDRGAPHLQSGGSTWHWHELPRAINWWLERHLHPAPLTRFPQ
jgi:hypothetical protein